MNPDKAKPAATPMPPPLADDDDREPTKEEIMEDLRIALRDVIAGEDGIPAREGIAAIRRSIYGDADHG